MLAQDCAAVESGRTRGGDGRARRVAALDDATHARCRVVSRDATYVTVRVKELFTLRERRRVRLDDSNRLERRAATADEVVRNRMYDFARDDKRAFEQEVARAL